MKKIIFGTALALTACFTSCIDVLDKKPLDFYSESDIWKSPALAQDNLYGMYGQVRSLGHSYGTDNLSDMQSDLVYTVWVSSANKVDNGWTVTNNFGWDKFGDVRKTNIAIENLRNPEYRTVLGEQVADNLLGQAYLIKACIYFQQARKFGGWIIVDEVLDKYGENSNDAEAIAKLKLPRATMKETYDYIIDNLLSEEHINMLNVDAKSGQLNRGSAYALLSEVCLHAGSYLEYYEKVESKAYYEKSIKAVEALDALNKYSLESAGSFHKMFDDYAYSQSSKEVIMGMYRASSYTIPSDEEFRRRYGKLSKSRLNLSTLNLDFQSLDGFELDGYCAIYPDPRTVQDIFYVIDEDGKARRWEESKRFVANFDRVKEASNYADNTTSTPEKRKLKNTSSYANVSDAMFSMRDQRFYAGIAYDGGDFMQNTVYTRTGGNYYPGACIKIDREAGSITGFAFKKFIPQTMTLGDKKPQMDMVIAVVFRLGHCYLNAAEAYINLGNTQKASEYLNKTRTTHGGLPTLTDETGLELKKIYLDERAAELMLENDRYFTLLRTGLSWGVTDENGYPQENKKKGVITRLDGGQGTIPYLLIEVPGDFKVKDNFMKPNAYFYRKFFYEVSDENKGFTPEKRYLMNVPQSEMDQNENLWQNEDWM